MGGIYAELEFYYERLNNFHNILKDILSNFPNTIDNHQSLYIKKYHKFLYKPDENLKINPILYFHF